MSGEYTVWLLRGAGVMQLAIVAVALAIPHQLGWRRSLAALPPLHRQMHWVYGGYVVLSISAFAMMSLFLAGDLASGTGLARAVCLYATVFWGVRLALQAVFDVEEHLTSSWRRLGYWMLTVAFLGLTSVYGFIAAGVL